MTNRTPVVFKLATMADLYELVDDIRKEDALETVMAGYGDPREATIHSAMASAVCFSARCGGDLLCLFGVKHTSEKTANVWEIGTSLLRRHVKSFLKAVPVGMRLLMDATPSIDEYRNFMPSDWAGYRSWAEKYLGAEFEDRDVLCGDGHAFRGFVVRRNKGA